MTVHYVHNYTTLLCYSLAYYGGYAGYPSDHHLASPPFYPPGYNGGPLPGPFFMRGATGLPEHSPPLPLNSPDYLSEHFQGKGERERQRERESTCTYTISPFS